MHGAAPLHHRSVTAPAGGTSGPAPLVVCSQFPDGAVRAGLGRQSMRACRLQDRGRAAPSRSVLAASRVPLRSVLAASRMPPTRLAVARLCCQTAPDGHSRRQRYIGPTPPERAHLHSTVQSRTHGDRQLTRLRNGRSAAPGRLCGVSF